MKQDRRYNDLRRAEHLVQEAERRVAQQKELVEELRVKRLSTTQAEALLATYMRSLVEMRNHEIILRKPTDTNTENTSNLLLNFMLAADRQLLAPDLKRVELPLRHALEKAYKPIEHVYFLEDGIASVVGDSTTFGQIEIGVIGKEGVTGLQVILGNDQSPYETFIQVPGSGLKIEAQKLSTAMEKSRTLQHVLLRYVQVVIIQTSQTALCNASSLLTQRLARWLLMCEDRLNTRQVPLTHEFLSIMLGVQRSGVTIALGELEEQGLIRGRRGVITILDRPALEKLTAGSYGIAEAEYKRRFGEKQS